MRWPILHEVLFVLIRSHWILKCNKSKKRFLENSHSEPIDCGLLPYQETPAHLSTASRDCRKNHLMHEVCEELRWQCERSLLAIFWGIVFDQNRMIAFLHGASLLI